MTRPKITPETMLCFDVYALQQSFGRIYKPLLDPLGLTYPQYLVMVVLWGDGPLTVGQIGTRLGLESSTLTPLIKRLEKAGLLVRVRDTKDERRVLVSLTDAGRSLEAEAQSVPACVEAATGLDNDGIVRLRGELSDLRKGLQRIVNG